MIPTTEAHDVNQDTIEMNESLESSTEKNNSTQSKSTDMKPKTPIIVVIFLIAIFSGVGTGVGLHKLNAKSGGLLTESNSSGEIKEETPTSGIKVGDVYGSPNEDTFKDSAEGVLQAGGLEAEGTHRLIRPGGVSQTVYLSSAVTDLDKFVGAKVTVWGETNTAQKAGWFMDVGRIKVLELNAQVPEESVPTATPAPKESSKDKTSTTKKATPANEDSGD